VVASFFGAKFGKHVESCWFAAPNWVIVAGYATGGWCGAAGGGRGDRRVAAVQHLQVQHPLVILAADSYLGHLRTRGFLNALFAKNFDQVNWIRPSY